MARTETLTAYRCKFSYMQRNNPIIDECREDIKSGKDQNSHLVILWRCILKILMMY